LLLLAAPRLMKALTVIGTLAMFLVGGGILTHGLPGAHDLIHHVSEMAGKVMGAVVPTLADLLVGVLAGALVLLVVELFNRLRSKSGKDSSNGK
jgi:predicted DNA repair protein MutK